MIVNTRAARALAAAGALVVCTMTVSGPVSAQNWDWGGGSTVGGSGREIVRFSPSYKPGQLVVSFGDRRIYHILRPGEAASYPIAIPREQSRWQGMMSITQKRENPSWTPTPTMRAENPRLPNWVPGGHPLNPLGVRALYLGSSAYRIHGTDAPWTIGQPVSKGCIRMYNQDVIELYNKVPVGTQVTVTWQRFNGNPVAPAVAAAPSAYGDDEARTVRRTQRRTGSASVVAVEAANAGDDEPRTPRRTQRRTSAAPTANPTAAEAAPAVDDEARPVRRYTRYVVRKPSRVKSTDVTELE